MYEHHKQPLAKKSVFAKRLIANGMAGLVLLIFSLGLGMVGYHFLEKLSWIDSLLNASMILGGMGPVTPLQTAAGKLFASFYALYSGVVLLAVVDIKIKIPCRTQRRARGAWNGEISTGTVVAQVRTYETLGRCQTKREVAESRNCRRIGWNA